MSKIRVYELARELKVESKALVNRMKELGIEASGHQSTLTTPQVDKIRASFLGGSAGKATVVVRRRKRAVSEEEGTEEVGSSAPLVPQEEPEAPSQDLSEVEAPESVVEPVEVRLEVEVISLPEVEAIAKKAVVESHRSDEEAPRKPELSVSFGQQKSLSLKTLEENMRARREELQELEQKAPIRATDMTQSTTSDLSSVPSAPVHNKAVVTSRPKPAATEAERSAPPTSPAANPTPARRTFSGGATIVRRATPEEVAASMPKPVEPSAPRSTGIRQDPRRGEGGVSPYSSLPQRPQHSQRPQDDRSSGRTGSGYAGFSGGIGRPAGGFAPAPAPAFDEEVDVNSRKPRDRKDRRHGSAADEQAEKAKARLASLTGGGAKKFVSARSLLEQANHFLADEDEAVDADVQSAQSRRTYTPGSGPYRKKDVRRRKDLKTTSITTPRAAYRVVKMEQSTIVVAELARQMSLKGSDLLKKLMSQGIMVTVNQSIDFDTASLIASEYGFECKSIALTVEDVLSKARQNETDAFESLKRPPIVTVMGHVDHGKTSILDAIRQADVAAGEAGGITQHIGAYTVEKNGQKIAFLDTPGHAAFSSMRARGARLTDIVILVVAADDGVMPQTREAVSHSKEAGVPIIVAINKIDKKTINLDRIYAELSELGIQSEEWGGDTQFVKVSALQKLGIDELLEAVLVQAELMELKARKDGPATGVVIEAHLDKGRGPVATIMVTEGQLCVGDFVVAGCVTGRVRGMSDYHAVKQEFAGPATPVQVIGLTDVPHAGDKVYSATDEKMAREIAGVQIAERDGARATTSAAATLDQLLGKVANSEMPQVPIILKGDVQGSVEAIAEAIHKLESKKVKAAVIHKGVGGITESDINLAETSGAVILGFNARASKSSAEDAERRGIVIKYFSIIYELIDAVKALMAGKLPPITKEVVLGHAEVRNAISVPKIGLIAGSAVTDGKVTRSSHLRLIRDDVVVYTGKISSLRRFKDDVREVQHGYECGISLEGCNDIRIGDKIEAFTIEESAATLDI